MIEIKNVTKTFSTKSENIHAVNEVSLSIQDGEIFGIIGYSGAGKSTLLKSILGLVSYQGNINLAIPSNQIAVHMQQNEYIETVPIRIIIEMVMGCRIHDHPKLVEMIRFLEFEDGSMLALE